MVEKIGRQYIRVCSELNDWIDALFLIVNERILRQKSTIISSNLKPLDILEMYSERTYSRLTSNYTIINLFGDDIRIKKRQKH